MQISIIIPCFNERAIIKHSLRGVAHHFRRADYEIVVVDDGSHDFSIEQIKEAVTENPRIRPLYHYVNKGKGRAVYNGLLHSRYPIKLILDADLSVSPQHFRHGVSGITAKLLKSDRYFIVKGQRDQVISQPWFRIGLGKAWKALVWIKTGIWMDTQCPFTIMHLPKRFYQGMKIDGFAFDVEILVKAKKQNIPIYTMDVLYCNGLKTSVTLKKTIQMAKDLWKI